MSGPFTGGGLESARGRPISRATQHHCVAGQPISLLILLFAAILRRTKICLHAGPIMNLGRKPEVLARQATACRSNFRHRKEKIQFL
jgi:hypothetical protein